MKPGKNALLFICVTLFLITGCGIKNSIVTKPMDSPVIMVSPINERITAAQLKNVIIQACTRHGWKIDSASGSMIQATLNHNNRETVTIEIPYSREKVEINYKSSTNMRESGGKIHRSYNRWVKNLDVAIRNGIAMQ